MGAKEWKDRYVTVVGETGWREQAACRDALHLFFDVDTTDAKELCRGCPVARQCLRFALDNDCRTGVWGGLNENERKALKRKGAVA